MERACLRIEGLYLFRSHLMKACGMLFAMLALIGTMTAAPAFAATRQYYIAAEDGIRDARE